MGSTINFVFAAASSAELALATPLAIVLLVLGFGFVIFVHELGHFLAAKAVGIKVSQFAIGFGHALLCWRKGIGLRVGTTEPQTMKRVEEHLRGKGLEPKPGQEPGGYSSVQVERAMRELELGETEYRLNWLPLGGYVKMLGQEDIGDQASASSDDPRSFNRKPIWARFVVISAGVVMNAIFAVIFFIAAFMYGVQFPPAIIGQVVPGSPAATVQAAGHPQVVGLRPGDIVRAVNDEPPMDFVDIAVASALAARDEKVTLHIERPAGAGVAGGSYTFHIEPTGLPGHLRAIGVTPPVDTRLITPTAETHSLWHEHFGAQGLRPGMRLVRIHDEPVDGFYQLDRALEAAAGKPLQLTFADGQGEVTFTTTPRTALMGQEMHDAPTPPSGRPPNLLGLVPPIRVVSTIEGMPAHGKLLAGDVVLRINDVDLPTWRQAMDLIPAAAGAVEFAVLRDGERHTLSITPRKNRIGVLFDEAVETTYVARVLEGSPFATLELIAPARIEAIAGKAVGTYTDIRNALAGSTGRIEVAYALPAPGGGERREQRAIEVTDAHRQALAVLTWRADLPPFADLRTVQQAENAWAAARMGFHKSWVMMIQTYQTLRALIGRTVPVSELRGPVGIADAGTQFAKRGWTYLMFFLGVISINLAVLNFLPIPILDGGLAVLLILEKVRGRPVPVAVHNALTLIGAALLLSLVLFVTYNDIWRLINS